MLLHASFLISTHTSDRSGPAHLLYVIATSPFVMADSGQQQEALRQAVALCIVRNKRRYLQKCQLLEAELQEQRKQLDQLRQWVATVLSTTQEDSDQEQPGESQLLANSPAGGIFLPPLAAVTNGYGSDEHDLAHHQQHQALQQQVLVAAAAAGSPYSALTDVLQGRSAALSSMLLTNIGVLRQLPGQPNTTGSLTGGMQGHPADTVASVSSFILDTLLHAPNSALSTAYMKQSAALLAAVLAGPASTNDCPAATVPTSSSGGEQQAVQVVQLMHELLQRRSAAAGATSFVPDTAAASGATVMLQQLSAFPGTAMLLCLASAQRLQQLVEQQQEACSAMLRISLASFSSTVDSGEQSLLASSAAFESSHELLEDLEGAVCNIPVWGVALANCSWTPRAVEDLVASAVVLYQSCTTLQAQQPLLASRLCNLCSSLATALQQLATNGDAPGMRVGTGAELRSVAGAACVKLRDLFMPASS